MAKLSEQHYAAIAILSRPKRGGLTYEQVADEVGISRRTLQEWRKMDEFNEELKREIIRSTLDRMPEIMASIPDHIINSGNAAMLRTLLQAHGLLTDKVEVETKGSTMSADDMRKRAEELRASRTVSDEQSE